MHAKRNQPTGVRARHARTCPAYQDREARCGCRPYYEASVYLKRDGKKVRKCFPTQAAAKAWRADTVSAMNRGKYRAPTRTTIKDAAEAWLEGAKAGRIRKRNGRPYRPSVLRSYEHSLTTRIVEELGHMRLSELRRTDVQDYADRLLADGLDPSTVRNTIVPLRAIYRRALQREEVALNPTMDLELPQPEGKRDRIASPDEARALLAALLDSDRALWATALYAGLRRGELRSLRWSDVDLVGREIHVARTWDDKEGEQEGGKSAAATRTVPIIGALHPELAQHKLRTGRRDRDLVFGMSAEQPFNPASVDRRAQAAWKDAGLERIGLHEARHTFASTAIAAGVNSKAISEAMGHSSIKITFDRYGHLMPGGREEAARRIDAYLEGATGSG